MINRNDNNTNRNLDCKKKALGYFLQEKAKGALIRSRISTLKDIDAPTSFFFKLERKVQEQNIMMHLKLSSGAIITDPSEMRKAATDYYADLFSAEDCDPDSVGEILEGLPKLSKAEAGSLDSSISFDEMCTAVQQLTHGRSSGIDGLPSEFYKCFWGLLGKDLYDVFKECFNSGTLPLSCTRAVLTLLPKKGDLGMLKNWRPISLLCTDYKILSKCLSNRLKKYLGTIVHCGQTYCVPGRTITDNLFLIRDIIDLSKIEELNVGLLSIDQEKAFDRVDHDYLFRALEAFGFGKKFISWINMLYSGASVMLKVGGGLSRPVTVHRGIRQGCPLSGILYTLAIEPLLTKLRKGLAGLVFLESRNQSSIGLSAYADDVTVFIRGQEDIQVLTQSLALYEKASSAKVNWAKCEGYALGQWKHKDLPKLPAGLQWSREGIKCLGVFLGSNEFQRKNWEGFLEKVTARLSRWTWVLPQLSYRGRVLVVNNLTASMLWHRFTVLDPPVGIIKEIQKRLTHFFWGGYHWTRPAVLYLPVLEGGQGLIDLRSRITVFRLQTAQRLLYQKKQVWTEIACLLLRKVKKMAYDKHLFLLKLDGVDLSETTPFYQSVLRAWTTVLKAGRDCSELYGHIGEEPLFYNPLINCKTLSSASVQRIFTGAGLTKLANLRLNGRWKTTTILSEETGIKSLRLLQRLLDEVVCSLPGNFREAIGMESDVDLPDRQLDFPQLTISAAVEEQEEEDGALLSFRTPELQNFRDVSKKALYIISVKVQNRQSLAGLRESKWSGVFAPDSSPRGSWRSLYKPPIEKRTADLQWRIVHGAVATNRHVAHIDPLVGTSCPFCQDEETLEHLWLRCPRLCTIFSLLQKWFVGFGEVLGESMFIFGPKYRASQHRRINLLNFVIGQVKMSIWLTRRNQIKGTGSVDPELMVRGLITARLKLEFAYYKMVSNLDEFEEIWGFGNVLCISVEEMLVLSF